LENLIVCYEKCLNKFGNYVEKQRTDVQRHLYAFIPTYLHSCKKMKNLTFWLPLVVSCNRLSRWCVLPPKLKRLNLQGLVVLATKKGKRYIKSIIWLCTLVLDYLTHALKGVPLLYHGDTCNEIENTKFCVERSSPCELRSPVTGHVQDTCTDASTVLEAREEYCIRHWNYKWRQCVAT
jgi:hypothetical protein